MKKLRIYLDTSGSKTMEEVRRLKAECNREVAHLPVREALLKRLRDSARTAEKMGFFPGGSRPARPRIAAEPVAEYRVKRATKRRKARREGGGL